MRLGLPAGLAEHGPWRTVYEGLSALPSDVKEAWFAFDHFYSDGRIRGLFSSYFRELALDDREHRRQHRPVHALVSWSLERGLRHPRQPAANRSREGSPR